jgi:hypothetical protein
LQEPDSVAVSDWRDNRYAHPRATPEKAFCDWLYLGQSPRSTLRLPPLDLEFGKLNQPRLRRLVKAMGIAAVLDAWLVNKQRHDLDPEVQENARI